MPKKPSMQIVTANHLLEGHSVYLAEKGWVEDYRLARIAASADDAAAFEAAGRADEEANLVIGVYLVDVEMDADGAPQPTHYREKLRVRARPSFWPDEPLRKLGARSMPAQPEGGHVSL